MIRPAARLGQDVIHLHHLEREMRLAAEAEAFLLAIKPMAMSAVIRELAQIGALRQRRRAAA